VPPTPATPSQALRKWTTDRQSRLAKLESRCVWASNLVPTDAELLDEHLRAFTTLLSAHFQGFCRDLYAEAALKVGSRIKQVGLRPMVQIQFGAALKLDKGNPTLDTLSEDFSRFGMQNLRALIGTASPADTHKGRLKALIDCRNKCAHGEPEIAELLLGNLQDWRTSCDWLASRLNEIVYDHLRAAFRAAPW
jgi:RiboL-PSP-HEPN